MTLSEILQPAGDPPSAKPRRAGMLTTLWTSQRPRVLGVIFLVLLMVAIWMTYAIYTKKFTEYDEVTLLSARSGLQLPQRADVKIRGVIVGEVLEQKATSDGAELTLGLYPDSTETIPSDVSGAILPKTLFGQKYVSLVAPEDSTASPISAGDTIERTDIAIEVQQVLDDIYPLLRAIRPADLNNTLNALSTALEGRGNELGETIETLDGYLKKINPEIPLLVDDLRKASQVSDIYADVLPQVSKILRDGILVSGTLEDRSRDLTNLFTDVSAFSKTTEKFLADNEDNLIRVGEVGAPIARTLARYSPEFPCLINGLTNLQPQLSEAFRNFTLHIDLELLPRQTRSWTPADQPRVAEDRGPACGGLPNPPWNQQNPYSPVPNINDGVDEPTGKGTMRSGVSYDGGYASGASYVGTAAERDVLNTLMAPPLGVEPDDVPDLGALLVAPMARGAEVELR